MIVKQAYRSWILTILQGNIYGFLLKKQLSILGSNQIKAHPLLLKEIQISIDACLGMHSSESLRVKPPQSSSKFSVVKRTKLSLWTNLCCFK